MIEAFDVLYAVAIGATAGGVLALVFSFHCWREASADRQLRAADFYDLGSGAGPED